MIILVILTLTLFGATTWSGAAPATGSKPGSGHHRLTGAGLILSLATLVAWVRPR